MADLTVYGVWITDSDEWGTTGTGEVFNTPHVGVARAQAWQWCKFRNTVPAKFGDDGKPIFLGELPADE